MKRFSSWITLILSHFLLVLFICLADMLYLIFRDFSGQSFFLLRLIIKIINWGIITPLIWGPVIAYPPLIIMICDKLSPSKKGTRYLVFGIIMFILYAFSFVTLLFNGDFNHIQLIICLSYISLIFQSKSNCN